MVDLSTMVLSETADSPGGTFCWMAPELLDPPRFGSNGRSTRESDRYALGMVIFEVGWLHFPLWFLIHPFQVLTGLQPFHRLHKFEPIPAVLRGDRPEKPRDAESLGFSSELWELVQLCWSESSSARPTAKQLWDYLSLASLTWVPPQVYPANGTDAPDTADTDSFSSFF